MSTFRINRKYSEFNESLLEGLRFYNSEKFKHSLRDFRDASEAFMKILILEKWGDDNGHSIITGVQDVDGNERYDADKLSYAEMLIICEDNRLGDKNIRNSLNKLKKTNSGAHNLNEVVDLKALANDCVAHIRGLSTYLSVALQFEESNEVILAFSGDQLASDIVGLDEDPWAKICLLTDNFSRENRYILVSPPNFEGFDKGQLQPLSRIEWSVVIDFNPDTKNTGLFSSFGDRSSRNVVHLTIKNRGQKNQVGSGGPGNINWIHANGLTSISDTVSNNIGAWRTNKNHLFLKETMKEFFSREVHPYVFIYLWDDNDYIGELFKIWDNVDLPQDLGKHIFVTTNLQAADKFMSYPNLGFDVNVVSITSASLVGRLQELLNGDDSDIHRCLVPGRSEENIKDTIDVTDIFHRLSDDGIHVIHQSIYNEKPLEDMDKVPAFLRGEDISWSELSVGTDVKRYRYDEFFNSIRSLLSGTKRSRRFDLVHKPGAGGTILGLRLAFDMRGHYPVITISRSSPRTFQSLSTFLDKVNQTVLAIVEASVVEPGSLDELIRECNSRKLKVVFVYVRRTLRNEKSKDYTFFLNDAMSDRIEHDKFVHLVKSYGSVAKAQQISNDGRQPAEFEVIDFILSINEDEFNNARLNQYVEAYVEKMPESHVTFLVYVSIVYYYAQKSVSHHVFRSLFKKSLASELKHIGAGEQFIRKILAQQFDYQLQEHGEYWRPRFSKFAEVVLTHVLGKSRKDEWKDHIGAYIIRFIEDLRKDNEFLVDETRDMLKVVFFERDDEIPSGTEQIPISVANERFSRLMSDVGGKERQIEMLNVLIAAYPRESHFQGQFGRFMYEKAEELMEFRYAEKLISDALETNEGMTDFNLHHFAGMCKSREVRFLLRRFRETGVSEISEIRLKELAESGCHYFAESVRINNNNVHGYVSHLQMLMDVIDYGRELSAIESRWVFLTSPENRWYMEKFYEIQKLIETCKSLIENEETLGLTNRIVKTRQYLRKGEGRALDLIGDFAASAEVYSSMIDTVERGYRPYMRIMTIYAILLGKVKGNKRNIDTAWALLKTDEALLIKKMLNENILQDPTHILSFKLWFKLIRLSNMEIGTQELISNLRTWFEHASESRILRTEAAFYLYVLYVMELIPAGESFSRAARTQCEFYLDQCRNSSFNKKFVFEYLGFGEGLEALINHRNVREADDEMYLRVEGTIATISARQEGTINLKCGLEAFFVPKEGSFIQRKDETADVTFRLGFRHEGLVAYDVRRIVDNTDSATAPLSESLEVDEAMEVEQLNDNSLSEIKEEAPETVARERHKIEGPKIVGFVDLGSIKDRKKKNK